MKLDRWQIAVPLSLLILAGPVHGKEVVVDLGSPDFARKQFSKLPTSQPPAETAVPEGAPRKLGITVDLGDEITFKFKPEGPVLCDCSAKSTLLEFLGMKVPDWPTPGFQTIRYRAGSSGTASVGLFCHGGFRTRGDDKPWLMVEINIRPAAQ